MKERADLKSMRDETKNSGITATGRKIKREKGESRSVS